MSTRQETIELHPATLPDGEEVTAGDLMRHLPRLLRGAAFDSLHHARHIPGEEGMDEADDCLEYDALHEAVTGRSCLTPEQKEEVNVLAGRSLDGAVMTVAAISFHSWDEGMSAASMVVPVESTDPDVWTIEYTRWVAKYQVIKRLERPEQQYRIRLVLVPNVPAHLTGRELQHYLSDRHMEIHHELASLASTADF